MLWVAIALINLRFRLAYKKQGRNLADLPFKVSLFPALNIVVFVLGALMFAAQGYVVCSLPHGFELIQRIFFLSSSSFTDGKSTNRVVKEMCPPHTSVHRAATKYDDGQVALDVVAVYIGLAFFIVLYVGYSIYHKVKNPAEPHFIPLMQCDFESGAVWSRGGGVAMKEEEAEEKRKFLEEKGSKAWVWQKVKGSVW